MTEGRELPPAQESLQAEAQSSSGDSSEKNNERKVLVIDQETIGQLTQLWIRQQSTEGGTYTHDLPRAVFMSERQRQLAKIIFETWHGIYRDDAEQTLGFNPVNEIEDMQTLQELFDRQAEKIERSPILDVSYQPVTPGETNAVSQMRLEIRMKTPEDERAVQRLLLKARKQEELAVKRPGLTTAPATPAGTVPPKTI